MRFYKFFGSVKNPWMNLMNGWMIFWWVRPGCKGFCVEKNARIENYPGYGGSYVKRQVAGIY